MLVILLVLDCCLTTLPVGLSVLATLLVRDCCLTTPPAGLSVLATLLVRDCCLTTLPGLSICCWCAWLLAGRRASLSADFVSAAGVRGCVAIGWPTYRIC